MEKTRLTVLGCSLGAAIALLLTGCASSMPLPAEPRSTSQSNVASPSDQPLVTASPSGSPVTIGCDQLLSLQNVYDFNPNYGANPSFTVPDQLLPLTKIGGVACGWINQTSGDTIAVGVAKPDATTQAAAANTAASSYTAVPTYGTAPLEGYFGMSGSTGVATVFSNGYWIVVTGSAFLEPGDATKLVQSVIANLPGE